MTDTKQKQYTLRLNLTEPRERPFMDLLVNIPPMPESVFTEDGYFKEVTYEPAGIEFSGDVRWSLVAGWQILPRENLAVGASGKTDATKVKKERTQCHGETTKGERCRAKVTDKEFCANHAGQEEEHLEAEADAERRSQRIVDEGRVTESEWLAYQAAGGAMKVDDPTPYFNDRELIELLQGEYGYWATNPLWKKWSPVKWAS